MNDLDPGRYVAPWTAAEACKCWSCAQAATGRIHGRGEDSMTVTKHGRYVAPFPAEGCPDCAYIQEMNSGASSPQAIYCSTGHREVAEQVATAGREIVLEYFTNPIFREWLEQYVWDINNPKAATGRIQEERTA